MKKTILIILTLFSVTNAIAQTQNVDSLINVLNTQKMSADNKLQLYWDILLCYWNTDLDKNISYATEAIDYANKEDNILWRARFNRAIGMSYYFKGEYDLSLHALENAVGFANKAGNEQEENAAYIQIGNMYLAAGNLELALKYYTDILPALERLGQYEVYANTLSNIVSIHNRLHNPEIAREYNRLAMATAEKYNLIRPKMFAYLTAGHMYSEEDKLDSAVVNIRKSYEIGQTLNDKAHLVTCTQMLSGMYSDLGDNENAKKYAAECLDLAMEFGSKQKLLVAWLTIAKVNFNMKDYKQSDMFASYAWEADSTDLEQALNASGYLCGSNIFLGNTEKANYFFQKYIYIRNQLNDKSILNSLADMEIKYETEKKDIQIVSLKKERKLYIWLGVAGLLFAAALGFVLWQTVRSARREKQLIATRSVLDGEMGERARLAKDLHDRLSGNLSAVKIGLSDNREALKNVCDKLDYCIEEVRRVAHNLMPPSLQFGLKIALGDFVAQFPNIKFHFFGKEERLEERVEFIVYCCANELITNAVRHSGAENINVQLVQNEKHISFSIQDDGCGFDEKSVVKGLGLKSIYDRVASCGGKIDTVSSPGKGSETTIELKTQNI